MYLPRVQQGEKRSSIFLAEVSHAQSLTDPAPLMGKPKPIPVGVHVHLKVAKMAPVWSLVELGLGSRAPGESEMITVVKTQDNGASRQILH